MVSPLYVAIRVVPVLLLALAGALYRVLRERKDEWRLRRSMKRAAAGGSVETFLRAAHRLIETRLSALWGISPEEVTTHTIQERLGPDAKPLVDVLLAHAALRFGRGGMEDAELGSLCSSIERCLRGAS